MNESQNRKNLNLAKTVRKIYAGDVKSTPAVITEAYA